MAVVAVARATDLSSALFLTTARGEVVDEEVAEEGEVVAAMEV
jgi:hypothetical protein